MILFIEATSKFMLQLLYIHAPVYHYTSLDGFLGIWKSQSLWASSVEYLNDSTEYQYGVDLCSKIISEKLNSESDTATCDYLNQLSNYIIQPKFGAFVTSFCLDGDVLSQWRGYGGTNASVSIGFHSVNGFAHRASNAFNEGFMPCKVIYNPPAQREVINIIIDKGIDLIKGILSYDIESAAKSASEALHYLVLPYLKHPGFAEEQEVRIVHKQLYSSNSSNNENLEIQCRSRGSFLVPYVARAYYPEDSHPVTEKGKANPISPVLPISKIIVGPSKDPILLQKSIQHLLQQKGRGDIEVTISKVPYRL